MAVRPIDADRLKDAIYTDFWEHFTQCHDSDQTALIDMVIEDIDEMPTLTPPNEPLMPDELKEMGGKPVWTVGVSYTDDGKWAMWDIVEKADDEGVDFGYSTESREWWNYNLRDKDGKLLNCAWVCYRRPTEGEEDA